MLDRCSCRRDNPSLSRCSAGGPVCHFSGRFRPCDCTSHVSLPVAHSSLPESLTRLAQLVLRCILETCAHWTRVDRVCMGRIVVAAAPRYVAIAGCLSWLAEQLFGSVAGAAAVTANLPSVMCGHQGQIFGARRQLMLSLRSQAPRFSLIHVHPRSLLKLSHGHALYLVRTFTLSHNIRY